MIGLALVTFVAVLGQGAARRRRGRGRRARSAPTTSSRRRTAATPFPPVAGGRAVATCRRAGASRTCVGDRGRVGLGERRLNGVDPPNVSKVVPLRVDAGSDASLAALGGNGAIVTKGFATTTTCTSAHRSRSRRRRQDADAAGRRRSTTRRSVDPLLGAIAISTDDVRRASPAAAEPVHVRQRHGRRRRPRTRRCSSRRVAGFPDAKVADARRVRRRPGGGLDRSSCNLLYVLLALSVVVSLFGMVNTLVLCRLRAHARDRHAARGRDDPAADAADDPARERDHGADRRRARARRSGSCLAALVDRALPTRRRPVLGARGVARRRS